MWLQLRLYLYAAATVASQPQQRAEVFSLSSAPYSIDTPLMISPGRRYMDCDGAALCGVLVLETGLGRGRYKHSKPAVHGLWPETGQYGSSSCIAPSSRRWSGRSASCYTGNGASAEWFERHEWKRHGVCAGQKDARSYFAQICALAAQPLELMRNVRERGGSLQAMATAVAQHGYHVWRTDDTAHSQIYLSACSRGSQAEWVLKAPADFKTACSGASSAELLTPARSQASCEPNRRGPSCSVDDDCLGFVRCTRCARSGFCTCVDVHTGRCV